MEWIFDGIGTEIISLIVGIILGIFGDKVYYKIKLVKNKQCQKAGDHSAQVMTTASHSSVGDVVSGNKYVTNGKDEFDLVNFAVYSSEQIENVIANGNDATRRKWCRELIINDKPDYLIEECISQMKNESEKTKLLEELADRNCAKSKFYREVCDTLKNGRYIATAINLAIKNDMPLLVKSLFSQITNNQYRYESLKAIFYYDKKLFEKLYRAGNCFETNETYKTKMREWINQKSGQ